MNSKPTIFVSVCSYRDPFMARTVQSLFETKSNNTNIVVSIFDQSNNNYEIPPLDEIIYKQIDPKYSNGVGWARHLNSLNLTNEDFYYQIDSHCIFDQDWDIFLINDYIKYSNHYNTNKIILSSSCKSFILDKNNNPIKIITADNTTAIAKYLTIGFRNYKNLIAHSNFHKSEQSEIINAIHLHGGNLFTHSDYIKNIGICPYLSVREVEQYDTMIAFAHDYKLCHHTIINNYHLEYNHSSYPSKIDIDPVIPIAQLNKIEETSLQFWKKFIDNLNEEILLNYQKYSGVDYINQLLESRAKTIL